MAAVMMKCYIPSCVFEACNTALVPLQTLDHVPFPLPVLMNGVHKVSCVDLVQCINKHRDDGQ